MYLRSALLLNVQSEAYCLIASLCWWVNRSPKGSAVAFRFWNSFSEPVQVFRKQNRTSCLCDLSSAVRFATVMCTAVILATPLGRRVGFCLQFTLSVLPGLRLIDLINCWPLGNGEYFPIQKWAFGGWKMLLLPLTYILLVHVFIVSLSSWSKYLKQELTFMSLKIRKLMFII